MLNIPLGLDSKSRFSLSFLPLRMISAPVSQDESLDIGRGFGRRGVGGLYSPSSLLVAPTASGPRAIWKIQLRSFDLPKGPRWKKRVLAAFV